MSTSSRRLSYVTRTYLWSSKLQQVTCMSTPPSGGPSGPTSGSLPINGPAIEFPARAQRHCSQPSDPMPCRWIISHPCRWVQVKVVASGKATATPFRWISVYVYVRLSRDQMFLLCCCCSCYYYCYCGCCCRRRCRRCCCCAILFLGPHTDADSFRTLNDLWRWEVKTTPRVGQSRSQEAIWLGPLDRFVHGLFEVL